MNFQHDILEMGIGVMYLEWKIGEITDTEYKNILCYYGYCKDTSFNTSYIFATIKFECNNVLLSSCLDVVCRVIMTVFTRLDAVCRVIMTVFSCLDVVCWVIMMIVTCLDVVCLVI